MSVEAGNDKETPEEELHGQMGFLDHLEELRTRIFRMLIAVGIAFAACWWIAPELFRIISKPILATGAELNMTAVTEAFNLELKLAFVAAIFLSSPFIMAQIWLFIAPGLYKHERRYAGPFIVFSSLLFILGGVFGYFVAFPFAVKFLVDMGKDIQLRTLISASEYFDLFFAVELCLGIVFEIPAVIFILSRIGLVSGSFLLKNTKYAVLGSFVVAAIITPTSDIPNMMVVAIPMIGLYLLGVVIAYIFGKKRTKE